MPESLGVLVIDGSAQYRSLISAVLVEHGYEVVQASDASSAVEQLGKRQFSVVLLDLKMPYNGIAFIDYLSDALPLVLARTIAFVPWIDRPIWGVLPKPFQVDELVKTVAACARRDG